MNQTDFVQSLRKTMPDLSWQLRYKLLTVYVDSLPLAEKVNILSNAVLVGGMLAYVMFPDHLLTGFAIAAAQVGFGELVVMYVLGMPLLFALRKGNLAGKLLHSSHVSR